jgi:FkbM family methyltransferase
VTTEGELQRVRAELETLRHDLMSRLAAERSRRRGPLMLQLHEVRRMLDAGYRYSSQAGQDALVDRLFDGRRGGTFVDVGGYDGVGGSNTLFLEQMRGWTGVLVEPVPRQCARAAAVRRCPCLGLAVAPEDGEAGFIEIDAGYTQMSGLAETYDPTLLERVRADPRHREAMIRVETRTLSRILTEAGLPDPDFVSLDIEGGELAVLSAFPFTRHRVKVWAIENNTGTPAIGQIMRASGHELVEFCGPDEIWRRRDAW